MTQLFGKAAALRAAVAASTVLVCALVACNALHAGELYAPVAGRTPAPPIGWTQFCQTYANECDTEPLPPHDIVLTDKALEALTKVNNWVNHTINPARLRALAAVMDRDCQPGAIGGSRRTRSPQRR